MGYRCQRVSIADVCRYILGAGMAAVCFVLSIFWVPESKYDRSLVAYGQITEAVAEGKLEDEASAPRPVRMSERPVFDLATYKPRTIWSDMRVFAVKPDWPEGFFAFVVSRDRRVTSEPLLTAL